MNDPLPVASRAVLDRVAPGVVPTVLARSRSRVDAGHWWWRARVSVAGAADGLVLFAPGPRPYAETVPYADLGNSVYHATTGELVLAPAAGIRVRRLRLPPVTGHRILVQIIKENSDHA